MNSNTVGDFPREWTPKGWQCPVCGVVHAPFVLSCSCAKKQEFWSIGFDSTKPGSDETKQ